MAANNRADGLSPPSDPFLVKIRQQVIDALGEPGDFQRVQVRHLWDNRYRANVLAEFNSLCIEILHSFFVTVDDEGAIVASLPKMKQLY